MINRTYSIPAPTSVDTGYSVDVSTMGAKCVYVGGTFTATVQIQISADGANWADEGTAFTAPGSLEITKPAIYVRVNTTAYTSGTPVVFLVGQLSSDGGRPVTSAAR